MVTAAIVIIIMMMMLMMVVMMMMLTMVMVMVMVMMVMMIRFEAAEGEPGARRQGCWQRSAGPAGCAGSVRKRIRMGKTTTWVENLRLPIWENDKS